MTIDPEIAAAIAVALETLESQEDEQPDPPRSRWREWDRLEDRWP